MTSIEWTHGDGYKGETWNPLAGCSRVSPGCQNCYAERFAARVPHHRDYVRSTSKGPRWTGDVTPLPAQLGKPLRWRKPRMVFVNSMSDLFHEEVFYEYIAAVFGVMAAARDHVFQVLTKRDPRPFFEWYKHNECWPEAPNILPALGHATNRIYDGSSMGWDRCYDDLCNRAEHDFDRWLDNVWAGVSVENADYVHRIDWLREVPASVRFLSLEPLLGPLDDLDLTGIHWVISGDESGHGARPAKEDWHRSIRDQCRAAGVPFFLKQRAEGGKKRSLPVLDGEQHAEFPAHVPDRLPALISQGGLPRERF